MEEWKAIEGTKGKILVSSEGRLKSLLRDERILKQQATRKGYMRARVTINREKMSIHVHREVAKAFIPNPENKPQVNHIDGDKANNSASNLEWVTSAENAKHAVANGLWETNFKGAKVANEKKRREVIATNGESTIWFDSVGKAERFFNSRHISDALKGKRGHVGGWSFSCAERG